LSGTTPKKFIGVLAKRLPCVIIWINLSLTLKSPICAGPLQKLVSAVYQVIYFTRTKLNTPLNQSSEAGKEVKQLPD
ncbi:MAG: hypothetical protein PHU52_05420, partial [Dehalococcoidales bacterium]|nr:hypothetical protein [Dehalococcoidales bacterium]